MSVCMAFARVWVTCMALTIKLPTCQNSNVRQSVWQFVYLQPPPPYPAGCTCEIGFVWPYLSYPLSSLKSFSFGSTKQEGWGGFFFIFFNIRQSEEVFGVCPESAEHIQPPKKRDDSGAKYIVHGEGKVLRPAVVDGQGR